VDLAMWRGRKTASTVGIEPHRWPDREELIASAGTASRPEEDIRYLAPLLCRTDDAEYERVATAAAAWLARIRPSHLPRVDEPFD
jgi:hypothetical protein